MTKVSMPAPEQCVHNGIHARWVAQGVAWAVCNLPKPRLINSIEMLERTLDEGYPIIGDAFRKQTEDQLRILQTELKRRNDNR